jgi:hypothetical protein
VETFERRFEKEWFAFVIVMGRHGAVHATMQYDLNLAIVRRLQENRVHVRFGFNACSFCLNNLSPADFTAVAANVRIQRHVLRFEGRDTNSTLSQNAAQRRDKDALAGM